MNGPKNVVGLPTGPLPDVGGALVVASRRWFREGLKGLLAGSGIVALADGATIEETLCGLDASARPALAVVSLEGDEERVLRDLAAIGQARSTLPPTKWVVLCANPNLAVFVAAVEAGVDGLLHVDSSEAVLQRAVELILAGQSLFPSDLARVALSGNRASVEGSPALPARMVPPPQIVDRGQEYQVPLSPREQQILQCLVAGLPNKVIARQLEIAEATVKVHIKGLLRKVKATNRTQAAIWAMNQPTGSEPRRDNVIMLTSPLTSSECLPPTRGSAIAIPSCAPPDAPLAAASL